MDRSDEFAVLVERARSDPSVQASAQPPPVRPNARGAVASAKQFNAAAAEIAREIRRTSSQLEALTKLVQKKSLFDDKSEQINQLTGEVKLSIANLNAKSNSLEQFVRSQQAAVGAKQAVVHSVRVVDQLHGNLKDTTKQFMGVLETRTASMKQQQVRKSQFGQRPVASLGKPLLFQTAPVGSSSSGGVTGDGGTASGTEAHSAAYAAGHAGGAGAAAASSLPRPSGTSAAAAQPAITIAQMQQLVPDQAYLESRANAMSDIESHIAEVGQIFNKLGTLINEQGEMVERIDDNVDSTVSNIQSAQGELEKYWRSVSSNKMLVAKVFAVLMFFSVLLVLLL